MKIKVLASTTATLILAATAALADGNFDRTLNVSGSPNVSVSTGSGYIRLHPGSGNQVHIVAHLRSSHGWMSGGSDADSRIQQIVSNPPIVQNGNDITIGERHNNDLFRNISIDYDITLPRASAITAGTGSGDIEIQDVGASLKAETGSGNVQAHGIHGTALLETGSGNIELGETANGDVRAQTGSGNIHLDGIAGGLRASTGSGDIEISGNPTTDWKLETGSGSIRMNLGSGARFNLNASTGSGTVHTSQPITMQGSIERHHIIGSVNGGGPTLRAETGSGDIEIR